MSEDSPTRYYQKNKERLQKVSQSFQKRGKQKARAWL